MPNNPDKKNTQDKKFDPDFQKGQQGKQGSSTGEQKGMRSGQPPHQGGQTGSKQQGSPGSQGQYGEETTDESADRSRRAATKDDPNKKWRPTSGGSDF